MLSQRTWHGHISLCLLSASLSLSLSPLRLLAKTPSDSLLLSKLGRIHSNFGFSNLKFWIQIPNSNSSLRNYEFDQIQLVEFEESNLNSKFFTIFRPKMHKIHPFWSKKSFLTILVLNSTKFDSLGLLNSSLIGRIRMFGLNSIKFEVKFELKFRLFSTFFETNSKFVRA